MIGIHFMSRTALPDLSFKDSLAQKEHWDAVLITAGSERQAAWYEEELQRRRVAGTLTEGVTFLAVPDWEDRRIGSGGATLNALRVFFEKESRANGEGIRSENFKSWWESHRVLIIHSGGDSRRLPQYSLAGKLFTTLPIKTPWGSYSTVFDEFLALSKSWAAQMKSGLVVASGDVILTFDASKLGWERPGVSGVAIRQPVTVGSQHGVYVTDPSARVYAFLQKPTRAQLKNAGGLLPGDQAAVDTGLLRFDAGTSSFLSQLSRNCDIQARGGQLNSGATPASGETSASAFPNIDLYEHLTGILTGDWIPGADDHALLQSLYDGLKGVPFHCDLVEGDFTHIGTTTLFRQIMTEETNFSRVYEAQQKTGTVLPAGVRSAGVIIDSVFLSGAELSPGTVAIECLLETPVQAERGAILHGLTHLPGPAVFPEDTVIHQVPVVIPGGDSGTVIRTYGVSDDPKILLASPKATWFGKPIREVLDGLNLSPDEVWPGIALEERSFWNAELFPVSSIREAWQCARWMMGLENSYSADEWRRRTRLSLASSTIYADSRQLTEFRNLRLQAAWQKSALDLVEAGSDVRPLLASPPSLKALALAGQRLLDRAATLMEIRTTEAASRYWVAGQFLAQSGLADESRDSQEKALSAVRLAVEKGVNIPLATASPFCKKSFPANIHWQCEGVNVQAPARIDFGGGWSDTPPFCLDWGGTVLNMAIRLEGRCPIYTTLRRLNQPLIRLVYDELSPANQLIIEDGQQLRGAFLSGPDHVDSTVRERVLEIKTNEELQAQPQPGSPFSIHLTSLQMMQLIQPGNPLERRLSELGGGLEIRTAVNLPMGSGLGTSSILGATMLQALAEMAGIPLSEHALSDLVMRLEQTMTTGGGWQDQAGGIFPGTKIISSGPGLRQRLRHEPVRWNPQRQREFQERFLLYYTGIQRIARNLLVQVVGRYLAREVATIQVLHSIKTLANEMAYAMGDGEWEYLGDLLSRHWELNQILDPHTTNAPLNAFLEEYAPWISGAKLAGAGGGGFFMLLARSPGAALELRNKLARANLPGRLYEYTIANHGLIVEKQ
jgi:fucokinase